MDFVFELISPTRTMQYQAESEHEMKTWVAVFANSTEYLLSLQQTRNDTEALSKHMDIKTIQLQKHVKSGLLATLRKENPICAECGSDKGERLEEKDWKLERRGCVPVGSSDLSPFLPSPPRSA
jgi:hypothetical protein